MSGEKEKPQFDEPALARLLEAAYVLQEHNRRLQEMELRFEPPARFDEPETSVAGSEGNAQEKPGSAPDYTPTLGQIVEIQHQIQLRHLDLPEALTLIADKVREIASGNGAGIGILEDKQVCYRAASGEVALPIGTAVPMQRALCVASLRTGEVIRCPDVNIEFLLDFEECHRRGIQSMIGVPIYHDGGIAGGLELYFTRPQAFTEQDVHTCQLMAGLVTEALARHEEVAWKKSLAAERAVMQQAFERVKPGLKPGLAGKPAGVLHANLCGRCGHELMVGEQFCGKCGTARNQPDLSAQTNGMPFPEVDDSPQVAPSASGQRSGTANGTQAEGMNDGRTTADGAAIVKRDPLTEFLTPGGFSAGDLPDSLVVASAPAEEDVRASTPLTRTIPGDDAEANDASIEISRTKSDQTANWSSASAARDYLQQLTREPSGGFARFWAARRGDVYLAIAVILVACVIRWGVWSNHSVSATASPNAAAAHRRSAPDAGLSFFDRMLIQMGLAEAPDPVESKGNPDTQVWVDLQTALYYCPGADLYGKTPKGRFSSQRDAQLDSFEPALRKACN